MAEKSVLILIEDAYEDMELMYPKYRLQEAGYQVVVAVQSRDTSTSANMDTHARAMRRLPTCGV